MSHFDSEAPTCEPCAQPASRDDYGLTAGEAAARLSARFGHCSHPVAAPVVLSTGEVVASVCETCLRALPSSWGCEDCAFGEVRTFAGEVVLYLTEPCERH